MSEHAEIRNKEREVSDEGLLFSVLDRAAYGVLSMAESGRPYCVPMSYVRMGRSLFFHTAKVGRKVETIDASPRVAFIVVDHAEYLPGKLDFEYLSVYVEGLAKDVTDHDKKLSAYEAMISKYESGGYKKKIPESCLEESQIISLEIFRITGKRNSHSSEFHSSQG